MVIPESRRPRQPRPVSQRRIFPPKLRVRHASAVAFCDLLMAAMFHAGQGQMQPSMRCVSKAQVAYQMCRRSSSGGEAPAPIYNAWAAAVQWTQRPTETNMAGFALGLATLVEWRYTDPTMTARAAARITA